MADITYSNEFDHQPWQGGDLVQAEGDNGFNKKFNDIGAEFDKISATVQVVDQEFDSVSGTVETVETQLNDISESVQTVESEIDVLEEEIKKAQKLQFIDAKTGVEIQPNSPSDEFEVEVYNRNDLPTDIDKVYHAIIFPSGSGPTYIQHTFLYRNLPRNQIRVTVQFYNPGDSKTLFNFRILALTT